MNTIVARFRTNARAVRAYFELELVAKLTLPELNRDSPAYPWEMIITYSEAQQPLVLATVGRYGGVTFQEGDRGEGGIPAAHLP